MQVEPVSALAAFASEAYTLRSAQQQSGRAHRRPRAASQPLNRPKRARTQLWSQGVWCAAYSLLLNEVDVPD